ncbi:tubulin polyglutamylase TTLL4 isoform X2 [Corythoichthys intestinalis]|uniref:tubulin polyglutamylase TTLL4 isoform X2 n=1 Tax=Corythoichthys intestinalis TaxID=161448 RepID=UPI0025A60E7D|nr:tubulin polyglutamylase TTLL4 isoform X2 [Corythoichthys intestinalis]
MLNNKSPRWEGGCPQAPTPLSLSVNIDPKTVVTIQVPFHNPERVKFPASLSAQEQGNITKTQASMPSQPLNFNDIPSAIKITGAMPVGNCIMDTGDHSSFILKREMLKFPTAGTLHSIQGCLSMQPNMFELEATELSSTPSVPCICIIPCQDQDAKMGKDVSSVHAQGEMSKSRPVIYSKKRTSVAKFNPTPNRHAKLALINNPLQVIGVCPPLISVKPLLVTGSDANEKCTQTELDRIETLCGELNSHMPSSVTVSPTQKDQDGSPYTLPGDLMCSVTKFDDVQLTQVDCVTSMFLPCTPSQCEARDDRSSSSECVMQVDSSCSEEELPYELENACSDDDSSELSSVHGTSSALSLVRLSSVEEPMSEEKDSQEKKPALVPSLFPFIPPTLYFSTINEQVEMLPKEQMRLLKWKMSTVTPNVVKNAVARSHFTYTKKSHDWLGCWGHHMKSHCFKTLQEHQKLNHFPGTFQIGRKDRLWKNLSKMQSRFGKPEFSFFPRTFVLPQDILQLRKAWKEGSRQKWIIKPPASARGIGIQVIHRWSQMPRRKSLLVQKYLHKPYLIGGNKFDLRIYVYVTCYDPLRIYIFSDGLVRFASCKYSPSMKTLSNKFMHLTNYSVNKKNAEYQANSDDKACQGHKWTLKALWKYLGCRGVDTIVIWEKIKDIVIKTIIASEPYVNSLLKMHVRSPYSCHELFGFDIMLDQNLKPWILEVNISPSLHSNTALDVAVKSQMIRDLLNLAGFRIPQHEEEVVLGGSTSSSNSSLCGVSKEMTNLEVSIDEKAKRAFYLKQRFADQRILATVLDVLTPNDVRVLAESEDELSRRGEFERIFPSASSSKYLRFFESPRYLSIVLDQWEHKYWNNRTKGINLLRPLCQKGVHLGSTDPAHIWSTYCHISKFERHRESPLTPSKSRVVVIHQSDQMDMEREAFVSSPPTLQSPGSSAASSTCASPHPSL